METAVYTLAERCQRLIAQRENGMLRPRICIALAGIPGAGKTTLAHKLADFMNGLEPDKGIRSHYKTVVVGMDGFHLYRSQLDGEGTRRRGATFTFDAAGVVELAEQLKVSTYRNLPDIKCPSFDHAVKDPVPDGIMIARHANIVILEGLYLLLKDEPWQRISTLMDETWLVQFDVDTARQRLASRHVEAGICSTLQEGLERADDNDIPNGMYLLENSVQPTVCIDAETWSVRAEDDETMSDV
ncbi:P-loop containing nucleoside triphosphate hydrolase protein [Protomyces lactucae-debilis]|uniref:p-loop containing nucleoside triphosphate hydrolase protein n=1 Tax=Protomyces lactucae-debilis TaxID=2754530 RepID=A0A1Y2FNM8_PROLT|nr:P-loop containing nucleoside triphosphate hydrolase protein [Protomyces lactucae-debilis]ORY85601.1 P-loop containing nucleoside triphosphate hydrolase protein [Protomyces lactucae-debilis]